MSKRRRSSGGRRVAEAKFWGQTADDDQDRGGSDDSDAPVESEVTGKHDRADAKAKGSREAAIVVRPTPDPAALVRSLGAPPLAVDASLAERHLTAVYEEAVRAATALAAASGLLAGVTDEA